MHSMEMSQTEHIEFSAPSGQIKCSLISARDSRDELALVFPGASYSCKMPLLYYSIEALLIKGYRVLTIDKLYAEDTVWSSSKSRESAFKYVEDDTLQLLPQISKKFTNTIKILLGRSLGSFQMACALEKQLVHPKQIVWQCPSLYEKWPVIKNCGIQGLAIIGTTDERYSTALPHFPNDRLIIEQANHSLEIEGNVTQSIEILNKVIQTTNNWLLPSGSN